MSDTPLTPEQIQNWRELLFHQLGPYALIAPESEIQRIRDAHQYAIDAIPPQPDPGQRSVQASFAAKPKSALALAMEKAGINPKEKQP